MTGQSAGSRGSGPPRRAARGWVVLALVVVGLAGAAAFGLAGLLAICGISGCSGGGFGRATDPQLTLTLIALAGAAVAVPLLLYAVWLRSARMASAAVVAGVLLSLLVGVTIGADWRGCPRSISQATCLEESNR